MNGESLMAVKKDWKISQVVMVITRKILNLLGVAKCTKMDPEGWWLMMMLAIKCLAVIDYASFFILPNG